METQNVSAQLYSKQLPFDPSTASYNCQNTYPNLSTCVDNTQSDANIEEAFQKQFKLSLYYKSPEVFNTMKKDFMDQTMEHENEPSQEQLPTMIEPPEPPSVQTVIPVGPTDFLKKYLKEGFGSTSSIPWIVILIIVIAIIVAIMNPRFFT